MSKINTHNIEDSWESPEFVEIGSAIELIKEAKFQGFSDGVTFAGNPIGESG